MRQTTLDFRLNSREDGQKLRRRRQQDRYGKSILVSKIALMGVKKSEDLIHAWTTDPVQGRWKKGAGDDNTYHEWGSMTRPALRRALGVPHQKEWKPAAHMAVRGRDCKAAEQ